jgi:hypothetical protein
MIERFIPTLQQECLDYFVVFGEKHMNYLVWEMVAYWGASVCADSAFSYFWTAR